MRADGHPLPVAGAATYWADATNVYMKDTNNRYVVIESKPSPESAAKCAKRWQIRENKAVTKANKP